MAPKTCTEQRDNHQKITQGVAELYSRFPFPSRGIPVDYYLNKFKDIIGSQRTFRLLDAGCGTGEMTVAVALQFPQAKIVGLDLSAESLRQARTLAQRLGASNISFIQNDLMSESFEEEPFDYIFCIGVLHHLASPQTGLRHLAGMLSQSGRMLIYLYGELGRHDLSLKRELLSLLEKDSGNIESKLEMIKRLRLYEFPRSGPISLMKELVTLPMSVSWKRLRERWVWKKTLSGQKRWQADNFEEITLADQLAHPRVVHYRIEGIFHLLEGAGLDFVRMVDGMPDHLRDVVEDSEIRSSAQRLPRQEQYRLIELIVKPESYTFVAKKGSPSHV